MYVIYSECVGHTHDYEQERGIQSTGERKVLVCTRLKCIFPVFPEGSQKTRPCRGYKSMSIRAESRCRNKLVKPSSTYNLTWSQVNKWHCN